MKGAHDVLITNHMRLWQKRSRLCQYFQLASEVQICLQLDDDAPVLEAEYEESQMQQGWDDRLAQ